MHGRHHRRRATRTVPRPARRVLTNGGVLRLILTHLLTVLCEWAVAVGLLVHAFEQGGARATGLTSLAIFTPALVGAPLAASLTDRFRALAVRRLGFGAQAAGFGAAAVLMAADAPLVPTAAAAVAGLAGVTLLRPTEAVLLPATVRSSGELTVANLWTSYGDSSSALIGPLAAAGLLSVGGPATVLGAAAVASVLALVATVGAEGGPASPRAHTGAGARTPFLILGQAVSVLGRRRRNLGVLAVGWARNLVIGALDVLVVVLAFDHLDLGRSGAGVLSALVGAGATASTVVITVLARRVHLTPALAVGLGLCAALFGLLAAVDTVPVALVALPLIGLCASLLDNLSRLLMQRSADPRMMAPIFALLDLVAATGLLVGSGLAQLLLAVSGVTAALAGLGGALLTVLAASLPALWRADAEADVPVVEMSLLRALPMFAPMPPLALETVARSAQPVEVTPGEVVISQGESGDRFYAVADGTFDITDTRGHIRTAGRGSFFGEVALLADVSRTATVTALGPGQLLAVDRVPFLVAVTGSDTSHAAAWGVVRALEFDVDLRLEGGPEAGGGSDRGPA